MKTIARFLGMLMVLCLCVAPALAAISKGPYLIFDGTNTKMTVMWQTGAAESNNTLKWGTDTTYSIGSVTGASITVNATTFQNKYSITGLQPGTKYYYQVLNGATVYGSGSFTTAPATNATAVKLLAYGDTRSTPADHEKVATKMRTAYATTPAYQSIALHAGDWVNADGETNWTNEWFVNTNPQMHAFQAEVPILGAIGNHEGSATIYKKYFPQSFQGSRFYYSFDYGPVHVTIIDQYTTYTSGSTQYNWIVSDLADSTKPWKIVMLHEPGYSANGGHANNPTVQGMQSLFQQYGVDMVIGGHNHYYSRGVVNGIQHLTLGGGGAPLYAPASGQSNIVTTSQALHHMEIDINGSTMNCTVRNSAGTVIETFNVTHASPPAAPTGLTATAGNAQAGLTWTASSGATNYNVKRGTTSGGPYTTIATGITATSHTNTGLTNGTAYYYVVTAVNANGESGNSSQTSATPKGNQTITFANPGAQSFGTTPTLTATATSGLTVAFTSSTTGVCTITSGGALTFVTTGSCTINADQAGNGSYNVAPQVSQTFTVALPTYQIILTATGVGSGAIHTDTTPTSADINCSSTCSNQYPAETIMTLTATTVTGSTFTGWSQDCAGLASCNFVVNGNRNVSATFGRGPNSSGPLAIVGQTGLDSIADAYQISGAVATIMALTGNHSIGSLIFDSGKEIKLKGGYDSLFQKLGQPSVLQGSLVVREGTLRVENIQIRPAP